MQRVPWSGSRGGGIDTDLFGLPGIEWRHRSGLGAVCFADDDYVGVFDEAAEIGDTGIGAGRFRFLQHANRTGR